MSEKDTHEGVQQGDTFTQFQDTFTPNDNEITKANIRRLIERDTRVISVPKTGLQFRYAKRRSQRKEPASNLIFTPAVSTDDVEDDWEEVKDVSDEWSMIYDAAAKEKTTKSTDNLIALRGNASGVDSTTNATVALPPIDVPQTINPWWIKAGVSWKPFGYQVFDSVAFAYGYKESDSDHADEAEKQGVAAQNTARKCF